MIAHNSLQVWNEIVLPTLGERQMEVLKIISQSDGITIYETAKKLDRFPNQVSGRFSELCGQHELIILDANRIRKVGNRNHGIWILTEKGKQFKI